MKTLSLELFKQTDSVYQLRVGDKERNISPADLENFIQQSQKSYESGLNLSRLGRELFDCLNGAQGFLSDTQNTLLQIKPSEELTDIAWELLHNGTDFLCTHPHKPFTPQRLVCKDAQQVETAQRPLRLLFMASSPEDVQPLLAFETEEAQILEATRKTHLELIVEESGSLNGLAERVADFAESFDVVHITGHADIKNGVPVFLLEDDLGYKQEANADEIAAVFSELERFPRLLFLSGCKTAQASDKALPSLCQALVLAGVPAVLGWAKPVYDSVASFAAQKLYELLANGADLGRAVAVTRRALSVYELEAQRKNPAYQPQWHYLRFYSDNTPLLALAVKGKPLPRRAMRQEFLDKNAKVEVCPPEGFVGRRRLLQQGLRVLRSVQGDEIYADALLLQGMGGLGKSSLAMRLCQRLAQRLPKRFIWVGKIDEFALRQVFAEMLPADYQQAINQVLNQAELPLAVRLRQLFDGIAELHQAVFVLDDFEQNFIADDTFSRLQPTALAIVEALASAIHQSGSPSRLLITCRYGFKLSAPLQLKLLPLSHFADGELSKKVTALRWQYLHKTAQDVPDVLEAQAVELGAGNPRLLEWLYRVLAQPSLNAAQILTRLQQEQDRFKREEVFLQTLLDFQTPDTRKLIATLALFEIFIPKAVLPAVLEQGDVEKNLQAAIAVGLVEEYQGRYFVSRLLLPLLVDELTAEEQKNSYAKAAQCLFELWKYSQFSSFEEVAELSRIAQAGEQREIFIKVTILLAKRLLDTARYQEAKAYYDAMLPASKAIADKKNEGLILNDIATIYHSTGDYDAELPLLEESLKIDRELGDKQGEGTTLNNLSQIYQAKGDYDTALRYLEDSLKIRQAVGDKAGEGVTLNNLSQIYRHGKGDNDTALRYLEDSLKIMQSIGDKAGEETTLCNISSIYLAKGNYEAALGGYQKSLKICQEIGSIGSMAGTLFNIGHIHWQNEQQKEAFACWSEAYQIAKKIGLAQALNNLEELAKQLGGAGLEFWEQF